MKNKALFIMMLIAFFFPSSMNYGAVTNTWLFLFTVLLDIFLVALIYFKKIRIDKIQLVISTIIIGTLFFYTMGIDFSEVKIAGLIFYLTFAVLITLDFKDSEYSRVDNVILYRCFSIIVIFMGFCMVMNKFSVIDIVYKYYSAYYPSLIPLMAMGRKPVLTFATHSVAGFAVFLFFILASYTFARRQKVIDLAISLGYCYLLFNMRSFTAYVYLLVALVILFFSFPVSARKYLILLGLSLGGLIFLFEGDLVQKVIDTFAGIFGKKANGFTGRYSSDGALMTNIRYIFSPNFKPVGFGFNDDLAYVDSGIVEYLLRGSIYLMGAMYIGFYRFLSQNLKSKSIMWIIFLAYMAFETGFTGLTLPRIMFMLPFMICYINNLTDDKIDGQQTLKVRSLNEI